jgi:anti-sigma factor (TIGR02949 family)
MSCDNVQERVSSFLDQELPVLERENVLAHIGSCRDCSAYLDVQQEVRTTLRSLKQTPVPADLTAKLRVAASHDRQRKLARATLSARWRDIQERLQLALDNMMRPLALPFAGGLASSMMIFGLLVPSLTFHHAFADEVLFTHVDGEVVMMAPNGMYSSVPESENAPRIQRADVAPPETANVVDLMVDPSGRVSYWSLVQGELTPDLVNIILLGQFNPATNMGVPIPSKIRAFQLRNVQTAPIRVRS